MKATTFNRTLLAAVMGSAFAFGLSASTSARAQVPSSSQAENQSQDQTQDKKDADAAAARKHKRAQDARDQEGQAPPAAEHGNDEAARAAAQEQQRGREQAALRQQQNQERQVEQERIREDAAQQREAQQAARERQRLSEQQDRQQQVQEQAQLRERQQTQEQAQLREREQAQRRRQQELEATQSRERVPTAPVRNEQRVTDQPALTDGGRYPRPEQQTGDRGADRSTGGADSRNLSRTTDGGDQRGRLPDRERDTLIEQQRRQAADYSRQLDARRSYSQQQATILQRQGRDSQYRYQQEYYDRLRRQQRRNWQTYDYYNDPFFYTAPTYRYYRGGSYYNINRYGADLLQQAINYGYREGLRAGQADRYDRWRFSYRDSYAYQDANYGYGGFYVSQREYNYYFREGFRRGYEDGYYGRRQYGRYRNGSDVMLSTVLSLILNLQPYNRY